MIRVNAYRCSHCGKLFLTEIRCIKHEKKYCNKSPCNIAACYSCKWYKETEQTTTITRAGVNPLTGYEYEYEKRGSHKSMLEASQRQNVQLVSCVRRTC